MNTLDRMRLSSQVVPNDKKVLACHALKPIIWLRRSLRRWGSRNVRNEIDCGLSVFIKRCCEKLNNTLPYRMNKISLSIGLQLF